MSLLTNYHTHTTFCDGQDSPEQMVKAAIEKSFTHLGFSAHSLYPFAAEWHLSPKEFKNYITEINRLKKLYSDKIEIYLGYEADYFPPLTAPDKKIYAPLSAEYLIGSTHYIADEINCYVQKMQLGHDETTNAGIPFTCFTVDGPNEEVAGGIKYLFNGDGKKAVQAYFSLQRDMMRSCDFDIIAHIDIIRKRNEALHFFNETENWYKRELEATAEVALQSGAIVEINTGGIARKTIDDVYPSADFLSILKAHNVPIMLNSDAHCGKDLDCAFDRAKKIALDAGYKEFAYYTKGSWKSCPING